MKTVEGWSLWVTVECWPARASEVDLEGQHCKMNFKSMWRARSLRIPVDGPKTLKPEGLQ